MQLGMGIPAELVVFGKSDVPLWLEVTGFFPLFPHTLLNIIQDTFHPPLRVKPRNQRDWELSPAAALLEYSSKQSNVEERKSALWAACFQSDNSSREEANWRRVGVGEMGKKSRCGLECVHQVFKKKAVSIGTWNALQSSKCACQGEGYEEFWGFSYSWRFRETDK